MTQETLLIALEEDANSECDRIISEAQSAAEEMIKSAHTAAEDYSKERLARLREDFARRRLAVMNTAKTRMNSLRLEVMNSAVDEVFDEVKKKVGAMPSSDYEALIKSYYSELNAVWTLDFGPDCECVVCMNPADNKILKDNGMKITPDPDVVHGVALASPDNRIRYENTVDARLRRARQELVPIIEKKIFG